MLKDYSVIFYIWENVAILIFCGNSGISMSESIANPLIGPYLIPSMITSNGSLVLFWSKNFNEVIIEYFISFDFDLVGIVATSHLSVGLTLYSLFEHQIDNPCCFSIVKLHYEFPTSV